MGRVSDGPAFYIEKSHMLKFHNPAESVDCLAPRKKRSPKYLRLPCFILNVIKVFSSVGEVSIERS
jgi:hypothetical protein